MALLLVGGSAQAHDPLLSSVDQKMYAEGMLLKVTMARASASQLLKEPYRESDYTPEHFPNVQSLLMMAGYDLLDVTTAKSFMVPQSLDVQLAPQNDVVFEIRYARPPPGPVTIRATYINKLQDRHTATLVVTDERNNVLKFKDLSREDATLQMEAPETPFTQISRWSRASIIWMGALLCSGLAFFYWLRRRR